MSTAQRFRQIESTARQAAEKCEAKSAEDLEIATWAQEILAAAEKINPADAQI